MKYSWSSSCLHRSSGKLTLTIKKKVTYKGKVWCPTTRSSYWIARRKGSVFITGNSQTPFTNLTFDWVCPEDLRDQMPYIGGDLMPFSYGDLQAEMDMINRAFIELMTEGDAKGRIFTFPLPTYNITDDFPWDSPNVDLLFEMTAKYGLPYFQAFIRSDLKPNMVRSMCLFPEETILFKENEQIIKTTIGTLFSEYKDTQLDDEWWQCKSNVSALSLNPESGKLEWVKVNKLLRTTDNRLVNIRSKDGKLMRLSAHHLVAVLTREGIETKKAFDIKTDDFILVIKDASRVLNPESVTDDDIELAWFIGLFIADGNYLYDTRYKQKKLKGVQISFNLQDKELIEKCKCFVKKRLNYEMKFILDKRYENSLYGYINNRKFAEFLCVEKGVQKYETLPSWLWNVGVPVILSFIDGFFSGDGYKAGKEIHINDEKLAKELNLLLQMVGISTTYRVRKDSQVIRIQHTLGRSSKGNQVHRDKLHDLVPQFLLDKRFVRNDNGKTLYQSYGVRTVGLSTIDRWDLTNEKLEWLRNSDFAAMPVASVNIESLIHQQEFYDIELEKNHYFVHSDGNISHNCCRLQLDLRELLKRGNGLFGSAEQTGSLGVVTINCARLGYQYKGDEAGLHQRLDTLLELGKDSLEVKREVIQHYMDNGLFPFTKRYLGTLRNHFSTLGVNGINEMIRNFTDDQHDITTSNGQALAIRLLDHIRARMVEFQEETGHMYNLEATPAEGTTYRFAKEDKKRYPDILQAGTPDKPYYTNSSQLPVGFTDDPFEALELQDELQTKYTGGCIEKGSKVITDKGAIKIEEIVNNFKSLSPISALSHNPKTGQSEWDLITEAVTIDVAKHQKITVVAERGVKITTSDWHPFFVMEKFTFSYQCPLCNKPVKNENALAAHLMHNPVCRENYHKRAKYQVVEKRADELKKGDYILQNAQDMLPEKSQLNSELAYLIGFFIGDGSISEVKDNREGNNLTSVRFFSDVKPTLEKIAHILNRCFDCHVKPLENDKHQRFMIETTAVTDLLFQYHLITGKNAYKTAIPAEVKRYLSKENFYSFLAGLIDSDGHIDKRDGKIEYSTVSEQLADDIVEMCTIAGVLISKHGKISNRNHEVDNYRVVISASQATLLKERLPLQRSKAFIKDVLSNRTRRQLPIVRVTSTSKADVQDNDFYDLTTEHNHNYLAGNNSFVFVHNTVLHLYMNERISGAQACKTLVRKVLERYRLPYITVTPTFSICPVHGYLAGEHEFCPLCDEDTIARKEGALLHD
jgi:ribonucleoside-triphosphate reductase